MKKILCLMLALCLVSTTGIFTGFADETGTVVTFVDELINANNMVETSGNFWFLTNNIRTYYYPDTVQDIPDPPSYPATIARRADGSTRDLEGFFVYSLDSLGMEADNAEVEVVSHIGYYQGTAGYTGNVAAEALEAALQYWNVEIYESSDNISYTKCQGVSTQKMPAKWKGMSNHTVVYTAKSFKPDTEYIKIYVPAITDTTSANGWTPLLDKVTFTYKNPNRIEEKTDQLANLGMVYQKSDNMRTGTDNIIVRYYPEHTNTNNKYPVNFAGRGNHAGGEALNQEGYLTYSLDSLNVPANNTEIKILTHMGYFQGVAGTIAGEDQPYDSILKYMQYYGLEVYESPDNTAYTRCEKEEINLYPAPWIGMSSHSIELNIKGLKSNTKYIKVVLPSLVEARSNGVSVDGWNPQVDFVRFTTTYSDQPIPPKKQSLTMSNVYMNDMVLQAGEPVVISGVVEQGTNVIASLSDGTNEYTATGVADSKNNFSITFDEVFEPGYTPYTLTVSTEDAVRVYSNLLFGDVFLLAGQSNMQWEMGSYSYTGSEAEKAEVRADMERADNPYLKVITLANSGGLIPGANAPIQYKWRSVTKSNVGSMPAIGYYFGDQIQKQQDYPVGLIATSWGGSAIGGWMKHGDIYNNHIYPYKDFNVKGMLWYQGESDEDKTDGYLSRQIKMIDHYRTLFGENMPVGITQLANYSSAGRQSFHIIREQQLDAFKHYETQAEIKGIQNTVGILSIIDQYVAEPGNIHPEGKKELAGRFVKWANAVIYGIGDVYSGPVVRNIVKSGNDIKVTFDHTGSGLKTKGGGNTVYELQAVNSAGTAVNVTGTISGANTVLITGAPADTVSIQYAYREYGSTANLMNIEGLAAPAFGPVTVQENNKIDISLVDRTGAPVNYIDAGGKVKSFTLNYPYNPGDKVVVALYDSGVMLDLKILSVMDGSRVGFNIPSDITSKAFIKVFVLDGLDSLKPSVDAYKFN